jgi:hypothetical protein
MWSVDTAVPNSDLAWLYNSGNGTESMIERTFDFLGGQRGYYVDYGERVYRPLVVSRVTPNLSTLDPVKHELTVGECTVELMMGASHDADPVRDFFLNNRAIGKELTVTFGTPEMDVDDYAPYFSGTIRDVSIADGIVTVNAQSSTAQALDYAIRYPWSNMHPVEVMAKALELAFVPSTLYNAASLDYATIKDDSNWLDCAHFVIQERNMAALTSEHTISDLITNMCRIIGAYFIPGEDGASVLQRYASTAAISDTWTTDDYTDFAQETTDGKVENSVAVQWLVPLTSMGSDQRPVFNLDPYGVAFGLSPGEIGRGVTLVWDSRDADANGYVYYTVSYTAGVVTVSLYKDSARTDCVCDGTKTVASTDTWAILTLEKNVGHYSEGNIGIYIGGDGSWDHTVTGSGLFFKTSRGAFLPESTPDTFRTLKFSDQGAAILSAAPGSNTGDTGSTIDEQFVSATGFLLDDIADDATSIVVCRKFHKSLHGFCGTGDADTVDAYRRASALRPVYLLVDNELVKCTAQANQAKLFDEYWPGYGGDGAEPVPYPVIPYITYTASERGALGSDAVAHLGGVSVHDVTLLVAEAQNRTTRFALGKNEVSLKTSFAKYATQLGDLVCLVNADYLAYGIDGLETGNSTKWEIIEKQPDLYSSPPSIKWRLMRV